MHSKIQSDHYLSPLQGTECVLHAFLGVLWAIVVDRDYIQRYRYLQPLAAMSHPELTNT